MKAPLGCETLPIKHRTSKVKEKNPKEQKRKKWNDIAIIPSGQVCPFHSHKWHWKRVAPYIFLTREGEK
jgi:hypothetical protein